MSAGYLKNSQVILKRVAFAIFWERSLLYNELAVSTKLNHPFFFLKISFYWSSLVPVLFIGRGGWMVVKNQNEKELTLKNDTVMNNLERL